MKLALNIHGFLDVSVPQKYPWSNWFIGLTLHDDILNEKSVSAIFEEILGKKPRAPSRSKLFSFVHLLFHSDCPRFIQCGLETNQI